jgi:hypothetical protein
VNNHTVLVDPQNRQIVEIIEERLAVSDESYGSLHRAALAQERKGPRGPFLAGLIFSASVFELGSRL